MKNTIKYDEAHQLLIDFINTYSPFCDYTAKFDGANITVTMRGVTFVFFLDAPGDGRDLDYLDHIETATGAGDFDDWSDAHEGAMNPIDTLEMGDRAGLEAILTAIYLGLVWS